MAMNVAFIINITIIAGLFIAASFADRRMAAAAAGGR
jgi:hypothetical protein